jgi:hypothetical protein
VFLTKTSYTGETEPVFLMNIWTHVKVQLSLLLIDYYKTEL